MTDTLSPVILEGLEEWLAMVANGQGALRAGHAVGWTTKQTRELLRDPQVQQAVATAKEMLLEDIETVAVGLAKAGNVPMIQMILFCHGAERGWHPPTHRVAVQHGGTVQVERIEAVSKAVRAHLEQFGPEMLALGSPLDDDITDAEVVDGDSS